MVPLAFALTLAFAPPTSSPTPAPSTLELQGQPRAPLVVLEPKLRRSKNPTARRLALGPKAITGLALSPTQIVVSTAGLAASNPVSPSDIAAPDRLAQKLTVTLQQQQWIVTDAQGLTREGRLTLISTRLAIAVIELDEPLTDVPTCADTLGAMTSVDIEGLERFVERYQLLQLRSRVQVIDEGHALALDPLPAGFEGAVAFDERGKCLGLVLGPASTGAATIVTQTELHAAIQAARSTRRELEWSVGFGLGVALTPDLQDTRAVLGRADLFINRRWDLAFETSWQTLRDLSLRTGSSFMLTQSRLDQILMAATGEYLIGRGSALRFGVVLGVGGSLEIDTLELSTATLAADCDPAQGCEIEVETSKQTRVTGNVLTSVGLDLLALTKRGGHNLAGVRIGYRLQLTAPNVRRTLNLLAISVQL